MQFLLEKVFVISISCSLWRIVGLLAMCKFLGGKLLRDS